MKKIKIAYIYINDLKEKRANINQTLHVLESLGNLTDLVFYSSWINNNDLEKVLKYFSVKKTYKIIRLPVKLILSNIFLEKISRLIYSIFVLFILKFSSINIIYTRDYGFLYFISILPKFIRPGQKIIYEMHTIYHLTSKKVTFKAESRVLKIPSHIIATTENTKKNLVSIFNIIDENIHVLPNGVDIKNFSKFNKDKINIISRYDRIKKTDIVVIYSGTFIWWKGVETFVKSSKYLHNINIKYLLVGGNGKEKDLIVKLVESEDMENRIIIEDFLSQDDLIKILISSDIAVIPNNISPEGENFTSPLKIFEYMACGLPIIASDLSSMRLILKDNINCIYFEPENEKDLALKIDMLSKNLDLIKKISEKNKLTALEYDWNNRAKKILSIINDEKKFNK